jgi:signal transduction histidine kinase
MHYSNVILLVVGIINLFLSFFVFLRNKKNRINIFFAITIFAIAFWCLGIAFFRMGTIKSVYFWGQFVYFTINFTIVFFLYFSFVFPKGELPKSKLVRLILFFPPVIIFLISLIPRSIISEAVIEIPGQVITVKVGWGYYVHSVITFVFMSWAFANLILKFLKSKGIARLQLLYLFIGTIISATIGIFTNVILFFYTAKYNWIGPTGTIIMVGFITYAITRYKLMDIKIIVARTIVFGLIIGLITFIYIVLSTVVARFFENLIGVTSNIIAGFTIAIIIIIGYQPTREFVERITNSFLYKKSYTPDQLLSKIAEVTASILNVHQLLTSISGALSEAFHCSGITVALLDKEDHLYVAYQEGFDPKVIQNFTQGKEKVLPDYFKASREIQVIDELKVQYESGEYQPKNVDLLMGLYQLDISLVVPLFVQERLIGVFAIGNKKSGDPYNKQDLNTLKIIAGQSAIAIENAILYDELKDFNVKLEDEVQKKTAELQKANEELRQLDAAKSEFISIASHQLRTPLTVIKGYVSMMQEGSFGQVPPKIIDNLNKIYISNERLIGLVENLLDISRIESGRQEYQWSKIHLEDLAGTIVENLKNNAKEKDLKLFFHKPKKPTPLIVVDANKLHEVMMNFVDNSIKYTKKGQIDVSVSAEPDGSATFCVKDTGMGIAPEIKPLLFRKFSRGKNSFRIHTEGVGLGLYVAKMLIDAHKGKIWAESEGLEKGATFCFSLPQNGPGIREADLAKSNPTKE